MFNFNANKRENIQFLISHPEHDKKSPKLEAVKTTKVVAYINGHCHFYRGEGDKEIYSNISYW